MRECEAKREDEKFGEGDGEICGGGKRGGEKKRSPERGNVRYNSQE